MVNLMLTYVRMQTIFRIETHLKDFIKLLNTIFTCVTLGKVGLVVGSESRSSSGSTPSICPSVRSHHFRGAKFV